MDIAIAWDAARFRGDWTVVSGGLGVDAGLQSAVLLSLFTDRLASADYVAPDGSTDRRGWWGDTYEPAPIGSRLWQLNRAKKSDGRVLLNQARDICREALQWLVDEGVAASVDVAASWLTPQAIALAITIKQPAGGAVAFRYSWAWANEGI